jgi:hypothetical protein
MFSMMPYLLHIPDHPAVHSVIGTEPTGEQGPMSSVFSPNSHEAPVKLLFAQLAQTALHLTERHSTSLSGLCSLVGPTLRHAMVTAKSQGGIFLGGRSMLIAALK